MRAGGRRARTLLGGAVATAVLACGAGELTARHVIDQRVAAAAGRVLGVAPDRVAVDTGGGPALLALAHRRLDRVELSGDDVTVGRLTGASVRVRMDGLRFGAEPAVSATHADVRVPAGSAAAGSGDTRDDGDGGLPVSAVVPDPATGTLRLELGGGIGRVTVRPVLRDGRVALTVTGAEFLGRDAAPAVADRIERRLAERAPRGRYPLALRATSVEVTSGGLHVTLDGGRAALPRRAAQAA
ncbi:LmeA family phospholipid-binding protein [Streptomyces sp. NPDC026673]|uniref:LmeA family phospholipid-binding protein n=1 Tax=Streptomyces sp. NPDC026673 TaxID=3155724 RepID=UPI0033FC4D35